jgi:diaminopropionate ammonia-lyase
MTSPAGFSTTGRWYAHRRDPDWSCPPPASAIDFHRSLDGYAPTSLVELPQLAAETGVGRVFAKDESSRLGLPAFKALGASWAIRRVLDEHPPGTQLTIVTATDGNHGRAVARFARLLGQSATIYVPRAVHPAAVAAITGEGAQVVHVDGVYDDAVAAAAAAAEAPGSVLVQDTAWEGYERVPGWIVDGYDTLLAEVDEQLGAAGAGAPDLILVPTGVGSLLQAVLAHYRSRPQPAATAVVAVEPTVASCIPPSLAAGHPVTVRTGHTSMAGLNCGTPSLLAWPYIVGGLDAAISVSDDESTHAAHDLAALGVGAGPCGAAPLAALRRIVADGHAGELDLGSDCTVVLLVTEGAESNPVPPLTTAWRAAARPGSR